MSQKIDWQSCESRFGALYATGVGRPGHPIGLMVGLQLLKHTCNVSDEEVVATWVENPYWQYFCGEQYFRHDLPIDDRVSQAHWSSWLPSLRWRW
jgi:transposase, IS5 family